MTSPTPIPKFDNPKMDMMPALQLFGAGREKRIYAIPPYTSVKSLDFEDKPFAVQRRSEPCALCGSGESYLDEVITDDVGGRMFVCSDSHYCEERRKAGHVGPGLGQASLLAARRLDRRDGGGRMTSTDFPPDAAPDQPLLVAQGVTRLYGQRVGCADVDFELWPGEVLGVVGESGSGNRPCCAVSPALIRRRREASGWGSRTASSISIHCRSRSVAS